MKEITMSYLSEETTSSVYKNTIQYLHDIAEKVPNTLNVLKSYYASKFRISELQTKICLEKSKNKLDERCPRCCLKLKETDPSHVVKAETKRSKFAQKVLRKVSSNQVLTRYQAKYLKKTDLGLGNQLVITCNFCKKEVNHHLKKPVKVRGDVNSNQVFNQAKKRRSRKKKDKFCGLQQDIVTAVQTNNVNHNLNKKPPQISVQNDIILVDTVVKNGVNNNRIINRSERNRDKNFKSKLSSLFKENKKMNKASNNLVHFLQSLGK